MIYYSALNTILSAQQQEQKNHYRSGKLLRNGAYPKILFPTLIYHKMYDERFHRRSHSLTFYLEILFVCEVSMTLKNCKAPRQDIVWLNEAMEADEASFLQLDMRNKPLDFNPSFTTHWIFDTILKNLENKPFVFIITQPLEITLFFQQVKETLFWQ